MLPAAVVSPFTATFADRYPRRLVLLLTDLVRAALVAAAAACIWLDLAPATVFVIAGLVVVASTAFTPAKNAILPDVATTPEQLTAANAVTNTFESASMFAGPALAGALLAFTTVQVVFVISAGLLLCSTLLLAGIPGSPAPAAGAEAPSRFWGELMAGIRAVLADQRLGLLVGMMAAQIVVSGMLTVFVVVLALDLLDLGNGGVGLLEGSIGVGGLLGGAVALGLASGRRLAPAFAAGMVMWGLPIALIAPFDSTAAVVVLLGIVGIGNTLVDVVSVTLLQRAAPDEVRGRVFGVLEGVMWGSVGVGAAITPALIDAIGTHAALVVAGSVLPVLTLLTWTRIVRLDEESAPPADVALLRQVPILSPLAPATIETLASRVERVNLAAGEVVMAQGEPGDRFYVIVGGEVEVLEDDRRVRTEGPGEFFGEIALLRDSPRTATVRTLGEVELLALGRDDFIPAVTGHAESAAEAEAVVSARLGSARTSVGAR
jgi:MFS family permease